MGQCAKSRSFQRWVIAQRPGGKGRGLCDVRTKNSRTANSCPKARGSTFPRFSLGVALFWALHLSATVYYSPLHSPK